MNTKRIAPLTLLALAGSSAMASDGEIIIRSFFPDSSITLFNLSEQDVDLTGWRLCTHNSTQSNVYSDPHALDGIVMPANRSLSIRLQNDANPDSILRINASDLGIAAVELEAYSMSLYSPSAGGVVDFDDTNFIQDHIQWSIGGVNNTTADDRSDEAVAGGVWIDQTEWIDLPSNTQSIRRWGPVFNTLHGPTDYTVNVPCPADLNGDGSLNHFDIGEFLASYQSNDPRVDFNGDGLIDFFDVGDFLNLYLTGNACFVHTGEL